MPNEIKKNWHQTKAIDKKLLDGECYMLNYTGYAEADIKKHLRPIPVEKPYNGKTPKISASLFVDVNGNYHIVKQDGKVTSKVISVEGFLKIFLENKNLSTNSLVDHQYHNISVSHTESFDKSKQNSNVNVALENLSAFFNDEDFDEDFLRPSENIRESLETLLKDVFGFFKEHIVAPQFTTVGDGNLIAEWRKSQRKVSLFYSPSGAADLHCKNGTFVYPGQQADSTNLYVALNWLNETEAVAVA